MTMANQNNCLFDGLKSSWQIFWVYKTIKIDEQTMEEL